MIIRISKGFQAAPNLDHRPRFGGRVYRYQEGRKGVEFFSHNAVSSPEEIVLDAKGQPWFTCDGGEIATFTGTHDGKESITRKRFKLKPITAEIELSNVSVTPDQVTDIHAAKVVKTQPLAPPF
jgi:hypothetical protein